MNKKILLIGLAVIGITGILAVAKAAEITQLTQVIPYTHFPKVEIAEGVAFDKKTNETKQVVFLIMNYGDERNIYLIVGDEVFRMSEIGSISNPEKGTKVFFYESEDDSTLTVLVQHFRYGEISIAGNFKDYLITFRHSYRYRYYKYLAVENPGLGKIQKEVRKETRAIGNWKNIKIGNLSLEEILENKKLEPISSWLV